MVKSWNLSHTIIVTWSKKCKQNQIKSRNRVFAMSKALLKLEVNNCVWGNGGCKKAVLNVGGDFPVISCTPALGEAPATRNCCSSLYRALTALISQELPRLRTCQHPAQQAAAGWLPQWPTALLLLRLPWWSPWASCLAHHVVAARYLTCKAQSELKCLQIFFLTMLALTHPCTGLQCLNNITKDWDRNSSPLAQILWSKIPMSPFKQPSDRLRG